MPSVPVGFHPEAIAEAAAAVKWYQERSDAAAAAFLAELDRAVESIAEAPERWPQYLHETRRFLLHRFPFAIVYRWGRFQFMSPCSLRQFASFVIGGKTTLQRPPGPCPCVGGRGAWGGQADTSVPTG